MANSNIHIELKIMTQLSCTSVKGGIFTPILFDSLSLCEVDVYEVSHVGRVKRLLVLPVLVLEKLEEGSGSKLKSIFNRLILASFSTKLLKLKVK